MHLAKKPIANACPYMIMFADGFFFLEERGRESERWEKCFCPRFCYRHVSVIKMHAPLRIFILFIAEKVYIYVSLKGFCDHRHGWVNSGISLSLYFSLASEKERYMYVYLACTLRF